MQLSVVRTLLIPVTLAATMVAQQPSSASLNASGGTTQISQSTSSAESKPASSDTSNAGHKYHVRLGTFALTGGYISGAFLYPPWPYGYYPYYGLSLWDPFWGSFSPYYYPADVAFGRGKGEIDLRTDPKDAEIYIDGAYAGTAQHLKHIWLDPGAYDLSISAGGRVPFHQRIYVLTGRTLSIDTKLSQHNQ